ncbi:MAG TPA: HAMP domain-containing sensor histidine kinase [Candidatus Dormibacteraeota bacterium]|nr:HAMP domain-containing sensor histidine kinase [Candidatus Dormibacteraeota bacterium]
MRKVALIFVAAVLAPSLVLAWLAVRSLQDQEYLLQRQQVLLYQQVADGVASDAQNVLSASEKDFVNVAATLLGKATPEDLKGFDEQLRQRWPAAQVGFVVTTAGNNTGGSMLCPSPLGRPDARTFCANNGTFLSCRESAEVYWNTANRMFGNVDNAPDNNLNINAAPQSSLANGSANNDAFDSSVKNYKSKSPALRNVQVQQSSAQLLKGEQQDQSQSFSKIAASEAEFCQLIGSANDGMLARFVDNKLNVLFWYRPPEHSRYVVGAQLALPALIQALKPLLQKQDRAVQQEICIALLDDTAKPVALSHPDFHALNWKRPFAATEVGEALPHWEVAVYLLDPGKIARSAQTVKLALGLVIALLVLAIGVGGWLLVTDLNRQLTLARQKTDFVSNVSHELKTPLTSIRMFSELLAEGRVQDEAKQRSYLAIITAEAARLTRLINNVLDFARLERGQKKYDLQSCDMVALVRETAETYRPHLEANGFRFMCELPGSSVTVKGDKDALAQVVVNLLSNAEKYSGDSREIGLEVVQQTQPVPYLEVKVLDRGPGVPPGCEEKIFEQFYRAHDSLSSGIQGSGLGLTLARQIARAHGGDVVYEKRQGGGSCFCLRLPMAAPANSES